MSQTTTTEKYMRPAILIVLVTIVSSQSSELDDAAVTSMPSDYQEVETSAPTAMFQATPSVSIINSATDMLSVIFEPNIQPTVAETSMEPSSSSLTSSQSSKPPISLTVIISDPETTISSLSVGTTPQPSTDINMVYPTEIPDLSPSIPHSPDNSSPSEAISVIDPSLFSSLSIPSSSIINEITLLPDLEGSTAASNSVFVHDTKSELFILPTQTIMVLDQSGASMEVSDPSVINATPSGFGMESSLVLGAETSLILTTAVLDMSMYSSQYDLYDLTPSAEWGASSVMEMSVSPSVVVSVEDSSSQSDAQSPYLLESSIGISSLAMEASLVTATDSLLSDVLEYASQSSVVVSSTAMDMSDSAYTAKPITESAFDEAVSMTIASLSSEIMPTPSWSPTESFTSSIMMNDTSTAVWNTALPSTENVTETIPVHVTSSLPPKKRYNLKVKFILSGNCSVLDSLKAGNSINEFREKMLTSISNMLDLEKNAIRMDGEQCGSIVVMVTVMNLTEDMGVEARLRNMTYNGELFTLTSSNETYGFMLVSSQILPPDVPGTTKPQKKKLTEVQIIVIIVCSIVGGMLLIYAFGFSIYACCQKKRSKSFDLGETPVCNMHMEDFTLTKLQRPQPLYTDYGPVLPHRGVNGRGKKKNGHYQPIDNEMQFLNPNEAAQAQALPQRSSIEVSLDTEIAPISVNDEPKGRAGFDNPSFSSDDILDSGPDTDQELPMDTVYSPQRYRDINNTNGHMKTEGATSF